MLLELRVKNFALIDEVHCDFSKGLNILTGETGAGKSILIDALSAITGSHFDLDFIKSGETNAVIEGVFDIKEMAELKNILCNLGIDDDDNLILARDITKNKGSIYRINGRTVTLSNLKKITQHLVDIHGQFEHQSILRVENHIKLLDNFGYDKIEDLKAEVKKEYDRLVILKKEYKYLKDNEREVLREFDLSKFQLDEIKKANLRVGEEEEILEELKILQNAEKIIQTSSNCYDLIYSKQHSSLENLSKGFNKLKEIVSLDENIKPIFELLQNSLISLEEGSLLLRKYIDNFNFDENRLVELNDRLNLIKSLKKKYGDSIEEILKYEKELEEKVKRFEKREQRGEEILEEINSLKKSLEEKCAKLSNIRKEVAKKLEKEVEKELKSLAMDGTKFKVDIKYIEDEDGLKINGKNIALTSDGIDRVEFLISPNPGEPLKPLSKIASGGEVSRIMLAVKASLSRVDPIPTLVFDEIDAGIGGKAGEKIAQKLSSLSSHHQVICITHLPTIASYGDSHLYIEKKIFDKKTKVIVSSLDEKSKVKELARMLRGEHLTEITLKDAEELLERAKKEKEKINRNYK